MSEKNYEEVEKVYEFLQEQLERQEKLDAFIRVAEGTKLSVNDLEIIKKEMEQNRSGSKTFNLKQMVTTLSDELESSKDDEGKHRKKLRKKGSDLERLRRQRRLQVQRERRAKKTEELDRGK